MILLLMVSGCGTTTTKSGERASDATIKGQAYPKQITTPTTELEEHTREGTNSNLTYPSDITRWQEVTIPPESPRGAREAWFYAANCSPLEWRVFVQDNIPSATYNKDVRKKRPKQCNFVPEAGEFHEASAFFAVDDGWLVGFNQGEFGAALYWFSTDGKLSYEISNHQVVDFFSLSNGIYAIEGLAHMTMSEGSVIRISRQNAGDTWQATSVVKLPYAPYAVSIRRDGTMLITLSDSLVSVNQNSCIHTLLPRAPWGQFYPNSSIISPDGRLLYIGMRQFVGEFDLTTNTLRLLIPSRAFLNKLPKDVDERVRREYR
jgi:hypothetical protein